MAAVFDVLIWRFIPLICSLKFSNHRHIATVLPSGFKLH